MKFKIITRSLLLVSLSIPTYSYAGLLGFLADVKTLGSSSGGSSSTTTNVYNISDGKKEEYEKAQKGLLILGFYQGDIDGNSNTFASRKAVYSFQSYFGYDLKPDGFFQSYFGSNSTDYHKGVLGDNAKNDLVYVYELLKEFEEYIFKDYAFQSRLNEILSAAIQIEKDISLNGKTKTTLSDAMRKELAIERKRISSLKDIFIDHARKTIWEDQKFTKKFTFNGASEYCANLELNGITDWQVPSVAVLKNAYSRNLGFTNIPSRDDKNWPHFWTSKKNHAVDFNKDVTYSEEPLTNELHVRCVYYYQ